MNQQIDPRELTVDSSRDLNRLAVHISLHQLAWSMNTAFSGVFLLNQGLSPAAVFLALGAIIVLRFAFRPAALYSVRRIGLRSTLILGTFLYCIQSPLLAPVHGLDAALVLYCVVGAIAQAFYWMCYHAIFAGTGNADRRGSQVGFRQILIGIAAVAGPALSGVMLTFAGPWAAFGSAAAIELAAVVPLRKVHEPRIARDAPRGAFPAARRGALLFAADGWIFNSSGWAWSLIMFRALGARFDAFGGALAAAALVGAIAGLALGRFIDAGHARRATWLNASAFAALLLVEASCGDEPAAVLAATIGATVLSGLYVPSLMTAVYNEAKSSPCPLRFHFTAEAGWDIGGLLACFAAAALCFIGAPLQAAILIALPMVLFQARLLDASYAALRAPARWTKAPVGKPARS